MSVQPLFESLERSPSTSGTSPAPEHVTKPTTEPDEQSSRISTVTATEASSEASRSLLLRTQFLRRVAHDIASPTGLATTVLEELAGESSRPELVAMARRGLRRLLRLSEQLALASDLEAGAITPETAAEEMRALVKDALEQAVTVDGRRDIVTSCEVPDERLVVDVDRRLITSMVREVIGNALRLASSRVSIDIGCANGKAIVRVQDDGPGFSTDALAHLGQRFTAGSTTRGLGLSLSLAIEILTAHGGELTVDASTLPPGRRGVRGAAVSITLPLLDPAEPR